MLLILIFSLMPNLALALDPAFECGKAIDLKQAAQRVSSVQQRYAQISTIEADFSQTSFMAALEVSESSAGKVWFSRPGLMRWEYALPHPQTFLVREKTMWFYQPRERQVLIDNVQEVLLSDLPVAFLLGIGNLSKDFVLKQACHTASAVRFDLEAPQRGAGTASSLSSFMLLVDANNVPIGARILDVAGNTTSIILTKPVIDKAPGAERFVANFPVGTDLIDRRKVATTEIPHKDAQL